MVFSFHRKTLFCHSGFDPESSNINIFWRYLDNLNNLKVTIGSHEDTSPAFAGMKIFGLFTSQSKNKN